MGFFSSSRLSPETVPTDRVIPLTFWDDQDYARAITLDITFTFNDRLDPGKLHNALDDLLRRKGWQKFGARLRRNKNKKLEYHIPHEFSEKRPAVLFSTDKFDIKLSEHPQLSALQVQPSDKPVLLGQFDTLRSYLRGKGVPDRLDDFLYSDAPQLAVHVVLFKDVTLVTVSFIHLLMDAMGFSALCKGWTAVLNGREDQIPPIIDVDQNPLETLHQMTPSSKYVLADRMLTGWRFLLFVVQYIYELVRWRREEEQMIFMPAQYLSDLRASALEELNGATPESKQAAFLSESDVLCSWWIRIFIKALNSAPQKPMTLLNVFDIRGVLAEMGLLPSTNTAMIANVTSPTVVLLTAGEILTKPLSYLASRIRHAIDTHRNPEQVQAIAAIQRESAEKTGHAAIFGNAGTSLFTCSNWHKGKLFQMDFSGAIVQENPSSKPRVNLPGRPFLVSSTGIFVGFSPRNTLAVMGKDAAGNWWMKCYLRAGLWRGIEKEL